MGIQGMVRSIEFRVIRQRRWIDQVSVDAGKIEVANRIRKPGSGPDTE